MCLIYTIIKVANKSHIYIKDKKTCLKETKIKIDYKRCIECGACPWGCPYNNIKWSFPPGGYGVKYEI